VSDEQATQGSPSPRRDDPNYGLVARLGSKARGLKDENKRLAAERDRLQAERDAAAAERDQYRLQADSNAERKRAEALAQQLRELRHKERFQALARAAGADPELTDDLWTLSGYQPEADDVDDAVLGAVVAGLKGSRPKFFGAQSPGAAAAASPPAPKPAPARGRGSPAPAPDFVTQDQLQDPTFMLTGGTKLAAQAIRAGRVRYNPTRNK
jgi:hypothetical protein